MPSGGVKKGGPSTRGTPNRGQVLRALISSSSCSSLSSTEVREAARSVESSSLDEVAHWKVLTRGEDWRRDLWMANAASATPCAMAARRAGSLWASRSFTQERKEDIILVWVTKMHTKKPALQPLCTCTHYITTSQPIEKRHSILQARRLGFRIFHGQKCAWKTQLHKCQGQMQGKDECSPVWLIQTSSKYCSGAPAPAVWCCTAEGESRYPQPPLGCCSGYDGWLWSTGEGCIVNIHINRRTSCNHMVLHENITIGPRIIIFKLAALILCRTLCVVRKHAG